MSVRPGNQFVGLSKLQQYAKAKEMLLEVFQKNKGKKLNPVFLTEQLNVCNTTFQTQRKNMVKKALYDLVGEGIVLIEAKGLGQKKKRRKFYMPLNYEVSLEIKNEGSTEETLKQTQLFPDSSKSDSIIQKAYDDFLSVILTELTKKFKDHKTMEEHKRDSFFDATLHNKDVIINNLQNKVKELVSENEEQRKIIVKLRNDGFLDAPSKKFLDKVTNLFK